ncbi:MAG: hypothetical protein AB7T49_04125 [Oligoflexales bacterium]
MFIMNLFGKLTAAAIATLILPLGCKQRAQNGSSIKEESQTTEGHIGVADELGNFAIIGSVSPWNVLLKKDFGKPIHNIRYFDEKYFVVHSEKINIVDAHQSEIEASIELTGAKAQDVLVQEKAAYISRSDNAQLSVVNLANETTTTIDLSDLADEDGNPDMGTMARCGKYLYVQIFRLKDGEYPTGDAALAVVDLETNKVIDADPDSNGIQPITVEGSPLRYNLRPDCPNNLLYASQPQPIMMGGGGIIKINLATMKSEGPYLSVPDLGGEAGGFVFTGDNTGWGIMHTEFGPGPSSHIFKFRVGQPRTNRFDTFNKVDSIGFDNKSGNVFFPNPGTENLNNPGVYVFSDETLELLTPDGINVGFKPRFVTAKD